MSPASPSRLPWIDHLRTASIVLVVNMHACVTYSHVGDWYMMADPEPTLAAKVPFIIWQSMLQSFFMGLLFFLAAYFAAGSLARRGPGAFVRERLVRLGLPALLYMLVIHPFILLGLNPWDHDFGPPVAFYTRFVRSGEFLGESGPLWFAVALLLFCLGLAGWTKLRPMANVTSTPPPSGRLLLGCGLGIGLASFAIRLGQPIGTNVLNLQLCFFAQYIAWFLAGVHAARRGWLVPLAASSQARHAGWLALVGGPVVLLGLFVLGTKSAGIEAFFGGVHWQALGLAVWEQLTGLGLALGALALFSRHVNVETRPLRWLADRSFGVYVLHAPVLIALALLFRALPYHLYGLVALLTLTGLAVSYVLADLARRTPGLKSIL
ncbi:glucans biosynthesis protein [Lacunisphaera limnophila]|uniref:Glucans biosynthesis protein n=1 Tax=Lacunisphaera limnophila TaxID=1838286 RepID=A0A1I7PHN4_9BACT|nr:acyltransferase [Lacunisphaera limnophila]AOS43122.1 glucans biosynthesis protein [Lacunisphaera limnophila]